MPPISVTCPTCATRLRVPTTRSRRRGKCPRCGSGVPLPAEAAGEETPTDLYQDLSAEVRSVCREVRRAVSEAGQRWLAAFYRAAGNEDRDLVADAVRHLRVVHAWSARGRLGRRRALDLADRIPADTLRQMAALARSQAGDWIPEVDGGHHDLTLREAFGRFRRLVTCRPGRAG